MLTDLKHIPEAWSTAWRSCSFRNQFALSILFFIAVGMHQLHYLRVWQARPGIQVNDFILNFLPPHDFSLLIFILEYSTLALVFVSLLSLPDRLVKGFQMISLMLLARTMSVFLIPLEQPRDMVALFDPAANLLLHTKDIFVSKDLFFSGHIGVISLLMLLAVNKPLKIYALIAAVAVGIMIMWQHVHYSMDVIFAPLVSYTAYRFVLFIHRETRYGMELSEA